MSDPRYFLDTNIFLRVVVKDDVKKAADCEKLLQTIRDGKLKGVTSNLVLAEIVWTCRSVYRIPKLDIIKLVRGIVSIPHLVIEDVFDILEALDHFEKTSVKFVDALIASHAAITSHGTVVISYDRDFDRLGILRHEPDDVLKGLEI